MIDVGVVDASTFASEKKGLLEGFDVNDTTVTKEKILCSLKELKCTIVGEAK